MGLKDYTELREHYEPGYKKRNETLTGGVTYIDPITTVRLKVEQRQLVRS